KAPMPAVHAGTRTRSTRSMKPISVPAPTRSPRGPPTTSCRCAVVTPTTPSPVVPRPEPQLVPVVAQEQLLERRGLGDDRSDPHRRQHPHRLFVALPVHFEPDLVIAVLQTVDA